MMAAHPLWFMEDFVRTCQNIFLFDREAPYYVYLAFLLANIPSGHYTKDRVFAPQQVYPWDRAFHNYTLSPDFVVIFLRNIVHNGRQCWYSLVFFSTVIQAQTQAKTLLQNWLLHPPRAAARDWVPLNQVIVYWLVTIGYDIYLLRFKGWTPQDLDERNDRGAYPLMNFMDPRPIKEDLREPAGW